MLKVAVAHALGTVLTSMAPIARKIPSSSPPSLVISANLYQVAPLVHAPKPLAFQHRPPEKKSRIALFRQPSLFLETRSFPPHLSRVIVG